MNIHIEGSFYMNMQNKIQNLTFTNYWMFSTVMSQEENLGIAKTMIEVITKRKVEHLAFHGTEVTEKPFFSSRGVRYDVKFIGDNKIYILEMQNYYDNLMQRSIAYHSVEKVKHLKPGEGYDALVETIVIFLCPFDYFELGEAKYTLEWREIHHPELNPQCGCTTILLNTSARSKDKALDALLQYCKGAEAEDALTKNIEEAVERIKNNEVVMEEYMRFEDYVQHERKEGIQQGMQQGIQQGIQKGLQQGIEERNKEICISMLEQNLDISIIEKTTGLSKEEILAIKNKFINHR